MSITLIAVVIALVVGHTMPSLVALRRLSARPDDPWAELRITRAPA